MTYLLQNSHVKCKGGCGTMVAKGKFDELCRSCWGKRKLQGLAKPNPNREQDPKRWHRAQTMCIFCHEQVRTIRAMKLHYHTTDHLIEYDKLTEEQREVKRKEREEAIANDPYAGEERRAWF